MSGPIRRAIAALAFAASSLAHTRAQAEDAMSLSLGEALERAASHAPEVVRGTSRVREAEAGRAGAGVVAPVNPRLSVDARPPLAGGAPGWATTLEALFEVGGAPAARVREVDRGVDVARRDLATDRVAARAAAWSAYLRASVADARLAQTRELIAAAERILDASRARAGAGASGDIEEAIASGDLADLSAALHAAAAQREAGVGVLRETTDIPAATPLVLTTALGDPPEPPPLEALLARAHETRPELAQHRARLALLDATGERLARETFPRVGAFVGVDASPSSPIFGVAGVAIELPFAQRNQGPRATVAAARRAELDRAALLVRRIDREVAAAHAAYIARRAELAVLRDTAVPSAERALELVETGWRAGRFDVFRVASAARDVARAHGRRLDALESAWLERVELDRASGGGAR